MSKYNKFRNYNPDILETIANLSNDEVFTPPKLANDILDLLPKEIWSDSKVTFLDPATKTGIFLREITSRLIAGLAEEIPDLQTRVNHILTKQVFGIGITELTTLMARRTVYCSTTANGEYSICTEFDNADGNIVFPPTEHTFDEKTGRCEYCGANEENYGREDDLENYAYSFIHDDIKEVFGNMKFDVIIGNPPYQLSVGNDGANSSYASAIYHLFVDKAIELNPRYIAMIIPSRWMTNAAEGIPKEWTQKMISSNKFRELYDFESANDIFNEVGITGGVNYFLFDNQYNGKCKQVYHYADGRILCKESVLEDVNKEIIIRDLIAQDILLKVSDIHSTYYDKDKDNFSSLVASYGFGRNLSTSWRDYKSKEDPINNIKYYVSKATNGVSYGWINKDIIERNFQVSDLHKIFIPRAHGGEARVLGDPRYGEPGSISSNTYAIIGGDYKLTKEECFNIMTYISTKFFRFMVKILKTTQGATRRVYQYVPLQDWSKEWTDQELYVKYKLTTDEINHIESMISQMDLEPSED